MNTKIIIVFVLAFAAGWFVKGLVMKPTPDNDNGGNEGEEEEESEFVETDSEVR
jgi:hypothetical protein